MYLRSPASGRATVAAFVAGLLVSTSATARAQPAEAPGAHADRLFREGKAALEAGRYAEACPKLAESQKLDPATGTLLALGMCHQAEGKTATAWRELQLVIEASTKTGRADRVSLARDLVNALEPRLSKITVRVDADHASDLQVRLDGAPLASSDWNRAVPVDPGDHAVDAVLAAAAPWHASVSIAGDAQSKVVDVPKLAAATPPTPPTPAPVEPETTPAPSAPHPDRTLGWIVGGAGIAALGVGSAFGVIALSNHSDATTRCPSSPCGDATGVQENDRAKTFAWVSDVSLGLGLVGVGVGAYLLFWPRQAPQATSARLVPSVGPGGAGVTLTGGW
jgi:hypothetical protein